MAVTMQLCQALSGQYVLLVYRRTGSELPLTIILSVFSEPLSISLSDLAFR